MDNFWDDKANIGKLNGQTYYDKNVWLKAGGSGSAQGIFGDLSNSVNSYIDSLMGQSKGQLDLALKRLDTEHKLALGNNDPQRAQFLENVADNLEQQIGRIPYDYQRYSDRELRQYALGQSNITNTREQALKRLALDEQNLGQQQGQANQSLAENLNERGLLSGQTPQGLGQPTNLTGLTGVAGKIANTQNNQFGLQREGIDLSREGVNTTADLQQKTLDFNHANTMDDLKVNARRDAQDSENAYTFGRDQANQSFEQQRQALERMRDSLNRQARLQSSTLAGKNAGILGY